MKSSGDAIASEIDDRNDRLAKLDRLHILDTPPEEEFDRLTNIAATIFDVPVALVSFVAEDRQWFKSCYGTDVRETDLEASFCKHAIQSDAVLVIEDAQNHPEFRDHPLVTGEATLSQSREKGEHVRAYAGAPIVTREGYRLGTLCVIDFRPRSFEERQIRVLSDLAEDVMSHLQYRRQNWTLDAIFEELHTFTGVLDPDGTLLRANRSALSAVDASPEDVYGTKFWETPWWTHSPSLQDRVREAVGRAAGGEFERFEATHPAEDGQELTVDFSITPIVRNGDVIMLLPEGRDITQRKETEQLLRIKNQAFNELPVGLLIADADKPDNPVVEVNEAFEELTGYGAGEILGENCRFMQGPETSPEDVKRISKCIQEEETFRGDLLNYTRDGDPFWNRVIISPVHDEEGTLLAYVGIQEDITEEKELKELLREERDRAQEAHRTKSRYVARLSHDMRTPLNTIMGMVDVLLNRDLPSEVREKLSMIDRSGQILLFLIDDILDLEKMESGELTLRSSPFTLTDVINESMYLFSERASGKGIALTTSVEKDVPDELVGDPRRIKQVLFNLIGNAIDYTGEGNVDVGVRREGEADDGSIPLRFEVSDTGPGIPEEDQERIFEAFGQSDPNLLRQGEGTGLGLEITRHLVKQMGGEVGVESTRGEGSTFWFRIPFDRPATDGSDASDAASPERRSEREDNRLHTRDGEPLNVLVADDSATNQRVIEQYLSELPVELTFAANGRETIDAFAEEDFAVVFMDLRMPEVDGLEATRTIRKREKQEGLTRTPIVALTGDAREEQKQTSLEAGCDEYVVKPVRQEQLLNTLRRHATG